jgi:hypothetical protein
MSPREGETGEPPDLRPLGHDKRPDRARDEPEREHTHQGPCVRSRLTRGELSRGGFPPHPGPGPEIRHDVAGLMPRGAVMILMSITRPQPTTA